MPVFAQALDLKSDPALVNQYLAFHADPWPEVVNALKEVGILSMRIYKVGLRLFMIYETVDGFNPATDFAPYLKKHPKCQEWEDLMTTFQESLPEAEPEQKWVPMDLIFEL